MKSHPQLFRSTCFSALATAVLLAGCQSQRTRRPPVQTLALSPASFVPQTVGDLPSLDPTLLRPSTSEYRLGPGDVLDIEIVGEKTSRSRTVVGPDGKVYFNMLPGLDVWGMTVGQVRAGLAQGMRQYVREDPPISVSLVTPQSQRIWLLGRLSKPGIYSLGGPMTLLEAISNAGGPAPIGGTTLRGAATMSMASNTGTSDDAADLGRAFVLRDGKRLPVNFERLLRDGDVSQNIYLQPDDFVYLPSESRGSVHVLGAVNNPRAVEYKPRLTLVQAVAQAGGTYIREAYASNVAIVRGSLTDPKVAIVDMNQIVRGVQNDVLLEPQDIVYVPQTPYRVGTRLLNTILDTFVRVIGVNEGARAVSSQATPIGVNVPIGPL